jgi:hypothetical protein
MLDVLNRVVTTQGEADATMSSSQVRVAEEVPFIEVGPRKSMEASPSVLAVAPLAASPAPMQPPALAPSPLPNGDFSGQIRELLLKALDTLPFADRLAFCEQALRSLGNSIKAGPLS